MLNKVSSVCLLHLRALFKALREKMPKEKVKKDGELLPGGDLRATSNAWVRSALVKAGLQKVPRERQIQLVVKRLTTKCKLCASTSCVEILFSILFDIVSCIV